jgi:hypothetical protein
VEVSLLEPVFLAHHKPMFDQLAKALEEKAAMTTDKNRDYSHRGGEFSYEPGKEPDLGDCADAVDLTKRYPNWKEGYERGEVQPSFPKTPMNDREG